MTKHNWFFFKLNVKFLALKFNWETFTQTVGGGQKIVEWAKKGKMEVRWFEIR